MNKIWYGLILGGILGVFDGATAWFTPEVRPEMATIIMGSTFKGLVAGVVAGVFARKVNNVPMGILVGLAMGAGLAFLVSLGQDHKYFWEVMLPGSICGAIVGFATQKYQSPKESRA
jgi:hypothetical protein